MRHEEPPVATVADVRNGIVSASPPSTISALLIGAALHDLARTHRELDLDIVIPALEAAGKRPDIKPYVTDALDDVAWFAGSGSADREAELSQVHVAHRHVVDWLDEHGGWVVGAEYAQQFAGFLGSTQPWSDGEVDFARVPSFRVHLDDVCGASIFDGQVVLALADFAGYDGFGHLTVRRDDAPFEAEP